MTQERPLAILAVVAAVYVGLVVVAAGAGGDVSGAPAPAEGPASSAVTAANASEPSSVAPSAASAPSPSASPSSAPSTGVVEPAAATLPGGRDRVFADHRFLVAYYGTAGTGVLGVLGERSPDRTFRRLRRAAAPFARPGSPVQPVFELIVTVADAYPGQGGDYNHDIARDDVRRYIEAAHRHGVLLILDIQPGRARFLSVVKRWKWALEDPYVGLALDPEWRLGPRGVPGRRIGSVRVGEINETSYWLENLIRNKALPQKVLMLHQFRVDMIPDIERVTPRRGIAMVQHVDGFGNPGQKLDTFRTVVRPRQFFLGFKLFYDEDRPLMRPWQVRQLRPRVRFVSYQ